MDLIFKFYIQKSTWVQNLSQIRETSKFCLFAHFGGEIFNISENGPHLRILHPKIYLAKIYWPNRSILKFLPFWAILDPFPRAQKSKLGQIKKITPGEVLTHVKNIKNITGKPDMAPKLNPKVIAKILKKGGWAGGCGAGRNFFWLKTLTVILQCTIYNMKTIH